MEGNHSVTIEPFAERYFIKNFQKKYKTAWDNTLKSIIAELERVDRLLLTSRAETIVDNSEIKIVKTEFRVIGTKESAKSSGNRCIVAVDKSKRIVSILLVYCKNDLGNSNETAAWKNLIKENYSEYKNYL